MSPTTETVTRDEVPRRSSRLIFVDLLRLLAAFQMIHGHTLDVLLDASLRHGSIHDAWTWVRGLTSVGFLFAAGIAFSLSTLVDVEGYLAKPARVAKRWRRTLWLVVLGYSMHFPAEWLAARFGAEVDPLSAARSLELFAMADVLQCIGVSTALLMVLTQLTRNARVVAGFAALGALGFIALAPLADAVVPQGVLRPLTNYLSHRGGSIFPLFPWSGFVFAGVAITFVVAPRGAQTDPRVPVPRLAAFALALFAVAALAEHSPWSLADAETTYQALPSFATLKLAALALVVAVLALVAVRVPALPRRLNVLAGESLMLYWFHLNLLYAAGVGLKTQIGPTLSLPAAIGAAALVIVVSVAVAFGWHRLKRRRDAWIASWRARRS